MDEAFQKRNAAREDDYFWVLPGKIAGRCGPDKKPWDLDGLWDDGFRAIASLHRLPPGEEQRVENSPFEHLPAYAPPMVIDRPDLQDEFLNRVDNVLPFIDHHLNSEQPVIVHCHAGLDRSCCAIACYLVAREEYSAHEAIEQIYDVRPQAFVSPGYEDAIRRFSASRNSKEAD